MIYILAIGGLALLLVSGDLLVRGAAGLAANYSISPLLTGLTIVAFGTSAPELMIGVTSALSGVPGIMLGDVVGSNIVNVLLVLGVPALIRPIACGQNGLAGNIALMIGVSLIFTGLAFSGVFDLPAGLLLLALLGGFLWCSVRDHQRRTPLALDIMEAGEAAGKARSSLLACGFVLGGLIGLPLGAKLLIDGAVAAARMFSVGEDVIGISLIAIGTSLPELAATLAAVYRRHTDVALGNVIGSNIFNILAVMGVTATIAPVPVPERFFVLDLWVMLGTAVMLLVFAITRRTIGRGAGLVFILAYALYIIQLFRVGGV